MRKIFAPACLLAPAFAALGLLAQEGPFSPEAWPTTIDNTKKVHYTVTDASLTAPSETWLADELQILTGGDQATSDYCIQGHTCKKVTGAYLNILDKTHTEWADKDVIDVLLQVYGDAALFQANGNPRNFTFLTGDLSTLTWVNAGQIPVEAKNKQWNWVLFRVANALRPDGVGNVVGGAPAPGGVNGGTIRVESVANLIVRVIAFGEEGAFGTQEQINLFSEGPAPCDMEEPNTNLAGIDIAAETSDHMQVINDGDQTVTLVNDVGPAGDKRKAVVPDGLFLNFGITDNYLGKPCNDPRAVKVCVDFYDDPAFAGMGVHFGPEAYALDEGGCIGFVAAEQRVEMAGSGEWIRRSWMVPSVNLKGVNAGALTAGPRFLSENGQVAVSRFELAVIREGAHPLAGQDPLSSCVQDANICKGLYGNFAELDLVTDLRDGLDLGSNGGDQQYTVEEAGPVDDRRMAIRSLQDESTPTSSYINFAITGEKLGPSSQDAAHLAICVTYYDDPNLLGRQFKPEVYVTDRGGVSQYAWTPDSYYVRLEGTDAWRTAYWEITAMKFSGVNQGPQAAARFHFNDKIHVTRVRYAVIRPCGPDAGVNLLEACKPVETTLGILRVGADVEISWSVRLEGWTLQESADLGNADGWSAVSATPVVQNGQNVVKQTIATGARFYRLTQ